MTGRVAEQFEDPMQARLVKLSAMCGQMREILGRPRQEFACAWSPMPWRLVSLPNRTPQVRRAESAVLREVLSPETRAVAKIESTLAFWTKRSAEQQGESWCDRCVRGNAAGRGDQTLAHWLLHANRWPLTDR